MGRTVQDVMTRDVVVAYPTTSFKELARLLAEHKVAALPVVDEALRPLGVVSATDLAMQATSEPADAGPTAADVMTSPAITVHPELPVAQAARLMHDRTLRRLLVVDRAGTLAGIVTRADLLKVFLRPDDFIRFEIIDRVGGRLPRLIAGGLLIDVTDGRVLLHGHIDHTDQVELLRDMVRTVDGVVSIEDRLDEPVPAD